MLYLRVSVSKGAAFIAAPHQSTSTLADLSLSLTFRGARKSTAPVRSSMDPLFSGTFIFPLAETIPSDSQAWYNLITSCSDKLHIACSSSPTPNKSAHKTFTMIQRDLVATGKVRDSAVSAHDGEDAQEQVPVGPKAAKGEAGLDVLGDVEDDHEVHAASV